MTTENLVTATPEYPQACVNIVIRAVAAELAEAQASCARLDGALGRLLGGVPTDLRQSVMGEFAAVDLLQQQIGALASFLAGLPSSQPAGAVLVQPAVESISLGDVRDRLRAHLGAELAESSACDSGDCDLF